MVTAGDNQQVLEAICASIEKLADNNISIDLPFFQSLLKHDDFTIRCYALALVPNSVDCEEMLSTAEDLASKEPDGIFANELSRLKEILEKGT